MTIESAIKLAIENGYGPSWWRLRLKERDYKTEWTGKEWDEIFSVKAINKFFLDRDFWICLGKGMGWEQEREIKTPRLGSNVKIKGEWIHFWYRLIDHLASEKSIESFFESLEKQK